MVREVREGTMILVDWGICRIQKVLLAQSQARARWFGNPTYHHQASLSLQHPFRERNYQCPQGALIISLPHVFPPTYVGFSISYILGNLIKAKITSLHHDDQIDEHIGCMTDHHVRHAYRMLVVGGWCCHCLPG